MTKSLSLDFYRPHKRVQFDGTVRDRVTGKVSVPPSKTKQSHLRECDINIILKQFSVTGMLTHINANAALGRYADLPDQLDYQESLNIVAQGEAAFASLPAKVRDRFENDPALFLAFMADPKNRAEAIELGLVIPPPPPPPPAAAPAAAPAPEPPKPGNSPDRSPGA